MTAPGPVSAWAGARASAWAWLALATAAPVLACVGAPPPPPEDPVVVPSFTTSGVTLPSTTGELATDGSADSPPSESGELTAASDATASDATTSASDCMSDDECQPGQQCTGGECVACELPSCAACRPPQTCQCPPGELCCAVGACIANVCDPLAQDCPEGEGCYGVDGGWACAPDASGATGASGDPCEFVNACDPGLVCLTARAVPDCMTIGCCSPLCDVTDPAGNAQCPAPQLCTAWYEEGTAPPGYEDVGACTLPA